MATASLQAVINELEKRTGLKLNPISTVCRPKRIQGQLRPDKGYSEHAYGNAKDIMVGAPNGNEANRSLARSRQQPIYDHLMRMKAEGYPVGTVIWAGTPNRTDHFNHLHVEGSPSLSKPGQKPPCAGGPAISESPVNIPTSTGSIIIDTSTAGTVPPEDKAMWEDISMGLFGNLPFSRGQFLFALVAIGAGILAIVLMVNAFKGKIIEQVAPIGQAVKALG